MSLPEEEFRDALEAARLGVATGDYDAVERAGLRLVSLARRARHERRGESGSDGGRPGDTEA